MGVIVTNIIAVFIMMGVGFIANRIGLLPGKANDYLSPLLIKITAPCMVFSTIASKEIEEGMWGTVIMGLVLGLSYFAIFSFFAWIVCAKIMKIPPEENCGVYMMLFASLNNGFIGLPITLAIFGEDMMFCMVFFQISLLIYLYGPGSIQIRYGEKINGLGGGLSKAILNPATIAAIIGLIIMFMEIRLPEFIAKPLDSIGDATTPISMIIIGIQLGSSNFKKIFANGRLMVESLIKMITAPVITFFLVNWLPVPTSLKVIMIFGASFPSAVATTPIAAMEGRDPQLAAEGVALTTLMSLVTIPVTASFLSAFYL
ncbi:MAG: AEC family transporter [Firmicutes bacterium]|nr:AEC family transporter [Bacillota bacterium]